MIKKTCVLSLLSIAVIGVFSSPIQAQQTSTQGTGQSASIVGNNNQINQYIIQVNRQNKKPGKLKGKHQPQGSYQSVGQSADIVGNGNEINQSAEQISIQQNNVRNQRRGHGHDK